MDLQILLAAHMSRRSHLAEMSASAEDRYYRDQVTLPGLGVRLLGVIATTVGVLLLLVGMP
ncbi:hypothetical protein EHS39_29090 [Ensifer sp. MPMI2T]|nr:hypothetical protein EHS39_29090 [Ensifer sp. MPMI2T]